MSYKRIRSTHTKALSCLVIGTLAKCQGSQDVFATLDIFRGKRVSSEIVYNSTVDTRGHCALLCINTFNCSSFNIISKPDIKDIIRCELSTEVPDIWSDTDLQTYPDAIVYLKVRTCIYKTMKIT